MAIINISFTTTARQDQALTWLLTKTNADAAHIGHQLATVTAMLAELLQTAVEDSFQQLQQARRVALSAGVETATNAQLSNAATALGVQLP